MTRAFLLPLVAAVLVVPGCDVGDDGPGDPAADAGVDDTPDADAPADPCATPTTIAATRPADLMPPARLATFAARLPCVTPGALRAAIESPDTLWYDRRSLVPGYQDSFGDNVVAPIGMRPNTIAPALIDTAVPGGHAQIFSAVGTFHFPFGSPIGPASEVVVLDFWHVPRVAGALLPVVWWRRDPNEHTHRVEWMFPVGTVFGEVMFLDAGGELHPFEIRTRTRAADRWIADAYRPFPAAADLAAALAPHAGSPAIAALITQLDDPGALAPARLAAPQFPGAFAARDGWQDVLPGLAGDDAAVVHDLLRATPFRSARGIAWKRDGARVAWAASASGPGSIVPVGYNAGVVEVSDASCEGCHRDAGRPFETWYPNILAYGELWGNDEVFTWHPFVIDAFVDDAGRVVSFNHDNRAMRPDLTAAGLLAPYDPAVHDGATYRRIHREWTDFAY